MDFCAADPQSAGFIGSMTRFVDCKAQLLGSGAYQALALPGSTLSVLLTGFLTIFIALIGYNLLLGRSFTVRSGMIAVLKVGAVFALATSWPAYRTLVYDLVTDGPVQIVGDIGRPAGIPGSDGTLVQRLDATDGALTELSVLGPGIPTVLQQQNVPPPPFAGFSAFALGGSRILFLLTVVVGIAGIRVITGLMLALGPFFIAFLMFDNTRSLFEGWVRVLAGAALAAIGLSIVLGLELSLLEPWLSSILAQRIAGEALPSVPTELFVVTMTFAILAMAVTAACARLARAFRLAPWIARWDESAGARSQDSNPGSATVTSNIHTRDERSRAAVVADVLGTMQRREIGRLVTEGRGQIGGAVPVSFGHPRQIGERASVPLGRSLARRAQNRTSARAGRRDAL
jgi:type IV secretion system protein VirB6